MMAVVLAILALLFGPITAPTVVGGQATWYCDSRATCTAGHGPGELIAAIDRKDSGFRKGDRVLVSHGSRTVVVRIVDVCACGGSRIIDLSKAAFARLADPSRGVIDVTIQAAGGSSSGPRPTLPPTDTDH